MINVSIADDERDTRTIEPWFLNAVNKLSNSSTSVKILKINAFVKTPLGGFKADEKEYENEDVVLERIHNSSVKIVDILNEVK